MNYELSNIIYSELIKGKYINEHKYNKDNDKLEQNELYKELIINQGDYTDLYKKIGLELENEHNTFYLSKNNINNQDIEIDIQQYKEYILINIIIRYLNNNKIPINDFINFKYGISEKILEDISQDDKTKELLLQADMINVQKLFYTVLETRNIIYKNQKNYYVLSDIGISFLNYIQKIGKELANGELTYE